MHIESKRGQAVYEFAVGVTVFAFVVGVLVEFAPVFYRNLEMMNMARVDAGMSALSAEDGSNDAGGNAGTIASLAHPPLEVANADAWEYPVRSLPSEPMFGDWRANALSSARLIDAGAKKDFTITMYIGDTYLLDHESGELSEEVHMPALGIPGNGGGQ